MKNVAASPKARAKESHPFLTTLVAIGLIALCIWASNWQYQRGVARHQRNAVISSHVAQSPTTLTLISKDPTEAEWRRVEAEGSFDPTHQILLRNRYFEGKYGFDLLTLFTDVSGKTFWIDRGWIAPGKSATTAPQLPITSTNPVAIVGRVRLDQSLPQGSFFAISPSQNGKLIEQWNAQTKTSRQTENFYLDLLQVSDLTMSPSAPVELPELSDGPHMAYALQWLFFAGLVGYGRLLLRRSR
ncbi:MAG: SURF1 family protein [Actinomycetota bacterium]